VIHARTTVHRGAIGPAALKSLGYLAALLIVALACGACARRDSAARAQPAAESGGGPAASKNGAAADSTGAAPLRDTGPLALQDAVANAPKPALAQAASSLAGHDRFLVLGDGPRIPAADFLVGALASADEDVRLAPFALLRAGLGKLELDPKAFGRNSWRVTSLVFGEAYSKAKAIEELRLGMPRMVEGGIALRFRLYGDQLSALGDAILHSDEGGAWLIEHFELDREALSRPRRRFERWEPPLALYP
jgi:hypothetical protein